MTSPSPGFLHLVDFHSGLPRARAFRALKSGVYWALTTAMLGLAVQSGAVTITFKEDPNEGPVRTIVEANDCPGCLNIVQQGGQEAGTASFSAPLLFFVGFPGGQVTQYQALLVEPAGRPGEVAGSISDRLLLTVSPADPSDRVKINVSFASDSDTDVSLPPANVGAVAETGELQNISNFRWYNSLSGGAGGPFILPSNLAIQVQSDVVPEPPVSLLLGAGVLVAIAAATRRLKNWQG